MDYIYKAEGFIYNWYLDLAGWYIGSVPMGGIITSVGILIGMLLLRNILIYLLHKLQIFFSHTTLNVGQAMSHTFERPFYICMTALAYFVVLFPFTTVLPGETGVEASIKTAINAKMTLIMNTMILGSFYYILYIMVPHFYELLQKYTNIKVYEQESALNIKGMFTMAMKFAIGITAFAVIGEKWNVPVTGFLASLGVLSAGIAFAAKDAVSNIFGSLTMSMDKFVKRGDNIKYKNIVGQIIQIGYRSTVIRTNKNELISIPNNLFANDALTNYSRTEVQRTQFFLRINSDIDTKHLGKIIDKVRKYIKSHEMTDESVDKIVVIEFNHGHPLIKIALLIKVKDQSSAEIIQSQIMTELRDIIKESDLDFDILSRDPYESK